MARLPRLERGTYGLEVRCSIQLSYRRAVDLIRIRQPVMYAKVTSGCNHAASFDLSNRN
jgi:hypothetical protein